MSKFTLGLCAVLLAACTAISQWHLSIVRENHAIEVEGWHYLSGALCDRIDERDDYIQRLEYMIQELAAPFPDGVEPLPAAPIESEEDTNGTT